MRGAERVFAAIAECWPEAPIYTSLYSSPGTEGRFDARTVRTSWLQRLPIGQTGSGHSCPSTRTRLSVCRSASTISSFPPPAPSRPRRTAARGRSPRFRLPHPVPLHLARTPDRARVRVPGPPPGGRPAARLASPLGPGGVGRVTLHHLLVARQAADRGDIRPRGELVHPGVEERFAPARPRTSSCSSGSWYLTSASSGRSWRASGRECRSRSSGTAPSWKPANAIRRHGHLPRHADRCGAGGALRSRAPWSSGVEEASPRWKRRPPVARSSRRRSRDGRRRRDRVLISQHDPDGLARRCARSTSSASTRPASPAAEGFSVDGFNSGSPPR